MKYTFNNADLYKHFDQKSFWVLINEVCGHHDYDPNTTSHQPNPINTINDSHTSK